MNNSNKRDVQDLIAEFVSSKNQLLHEEIISSIKRESFTNQYTEEESQTSEQTTEPTPKTASGALELEEKIAELTKRNNELQQELTMLQMQESQTIASAKPIGTDELRMEFLNFTSAHIQQFNTRIKRTEELIESQLTKQQQPAVQKSRNEYPGWLIKANLGLLALVSIALIYLVFFQSPPVTPSERNAFTQTSATAPEAVQEEQKSAETNHQETPASSSTFTATAATTEPGSTPFRKAGSPELSQPQEAAITNTAAVVTSPAKPNPVAPRVEAPVVKNTVPVKTTAAAPMQNPKPSNNIAGKNTARPAPIARQENLRSNSPVVVHNTNKVSSTKTNSEKKANEKVYFGED